MAEFAFDDVDGSGELAAGVPEPEVPEPEPEPEPVPDDDDEFEVAGGTPEEEEALAVAWNAWNDLLAVGLTAKTMPDSQWPVWWQKNQSGVVTLTITENWGTLVALAATGWKPESTPPAMGWQGAGKVDWVTVWFFG